jgi:outer membrane protein OmpA-like peptidoglycan-associated protein
MKRILCMTVLVALAGCATPPQGPLPPATPVFFEPWSASLDSHALSAIATAAQAAQAQPMAPIMVVGAADSTGSAEANKYISEARAQVVADQLVADGVARDRIKVHGVGTVGAPTQNSTPAQYARRVVIQLDD